MMKPKIIFFGTPDFAIPSLEALIRGGYIITAVVTKKEKPSGRGLNIQASPVQNLADKYGIAIFHETKNLPYAELFVITAYGKIIPKEIIGKPKYGTLNVHPSLLPRHRGPSPIATAVLDGDTETGVTVMLTDEQMDHGPILSQCRVIVTPNDTTETLQEKLAYAGAKLLIETIPRWTSGEIKPQKQNNSKATYTKIFKKEDGKIDWLKSTEEIVRLIRAMTPWPGAWTMLDKTKIKVLKAHAEDTRVVIDILQPEGRRPMTYAEFERGYMKDGKKFN